MGVPNEKALEIAEMVGTTCEICKSPTGPSFHIDHCHKTGKYRGLLCSNCNSGIGLFGDNPERLRAAAEYLES